MNLTMRRPVCSSVPFTGCMGSCSREGSLEAVPRTADAPPDVGVAPPLETVARSGCRLLSRSVRAATSWSTTTVARTAAAMVATTARSRGRDGMRKTPTLLVGAKRLGLGRPKRRPVPSLTLYERTHNAAAGFSDLAGTIGRRGSAAPCAQCRFGRRRPGTGCRLPPDWRPPAQPQGRRPAPQL